MNVNTNWRIGVGSQTAIYMKPLSGRYMYEPDYRFAQPREAQPVRSAPGLSASAQRDIQWSTTFNRTICPIYFPRGLANQRDATTVNKSHCRRCSANRPRCRVVTVFEKPRTGRYCSKNLGENSHQDPVIWFVALGTRRATGCPAISST